MSIENSNRTMAVDEMRAESHIAANNMETSAKESMSDSMMEEMVLQQALAAQQAQMAASIAQCQRTEMMQEQMIAADGD